eukprot:scaffold86096_cov57-Phaeocystis_antarctica.AAC.1
MVSGKVRRTLTLTLLLTDPNQGAPHAPRRVAPRRAPAGQRPRRAPGSDAPLATALHLPAAAASFSPLEQPSVEAPLHGPMWRTRLSFGRPASPRQASWPRLADPRSCPRHLLALVKPARGSSGRTLVGAVFHIGVSCTSTPRAPSPRATRGTGRRGRGARPVTLHSMRPPGTKAMPAAMAAAAAAAAEAEAEAATVAAAAAVSARCGVPWHCTLQPAARTSRRASTPTRQWRCLPR